MKKKVYNTQSYENLLACETLNKTIIVKKELDIEYFMNSKGTPIMEMSSEESKQPIVKSIETFRVKQYEECEVPNIRGANSRYRKDAP
jgi:hypothetical protein